MKARDASQACAKMEIRLPVALAESLRALAESTGHSRTSLLTGILRRAIGVDLDAEEGLNALASAAAGWRDWCEGAIDGNAPSGEVCTALVADLEVLRLSALIGAEMLTGRVSSDLSSLLLDRSREVELDPVKVFQVVTQRLVTLSRLLEDLSSCGDAELERLSRVLAEDLGRSELLSRAGLGLAEHPESSRRRQAVSAALEEAPASRVFALVGSGLGSQP